MSKIWIDYMAPCDVFFFDPVIRELKSSKLYSFSCTSRSHAETRALLREARIEAREIGGHTVDTRIAQITSFVGRNLGLILKVPKYDVSISLANIYAILVSKARGCKCISIIDNDLIEYERSPMEAIAARIHAKADWIVAPSAYPIEMTIAKGARKEGIHIFNGYKEDIYVADYKPDLDFRKRCPFDRFVVVRPEALYSTYVHAKKSIVPEVVSLLVGRGMNVIYLPRQPTDLSFIRDVVDDNRIWIPPGPLRGLDLVYYSSAVLTGSGTFAREAACMGRTAVSFFPDQVLAVDKELVLEGRMLHSRNPSEIVDHVSERYENPTMASAERSVAVKNQFISIIHSILERVES